MADTPHEIAVAEARERIHAILALEDADGQSRALAEYIAFKTTVTVGSAAEMLAAHKEGLADLAANQRPSQSEAWIERKRAAGTLGLAPLDDAEAARDGWRKAAAQANAQHHVGDLTGGGVF